MWRKKKKEEKDDYRRDQYSYPKPTQQNRPLLVSVYVHTVLIKISW